MNQQLNNLCAVPLVGRDGEVDLHRPHYPRIPSGHEHAARSSEHSWQDFVAPERPAVVERERDDEADTGAVVHDGIVTLTGRTETGRAARDLMAAVRHIEGVVAVRDQLYYPGQAS